MNETLFRCSSLGSIMTDSRSKTEPLSETAKTFLAEKYVSERYGRDADVINKYIRKALCVQDDAVALYSKLKKQLYKRNEFTLSNRYISGTPDLFTGPIIHEAETIIGIKSSWNVHTFFRNHNERLIKAHYWQLQGYMALTGAQSACLVYCLVNTPQVIITDEVQQLQRQMRVINPGTDKNFQRAATELERLAKYDDIPMHERVIDICVERNDADIERIYERIKLCRKWMKENLTERQYDVATVRQAIS